MKIFCSEDLFWFQSYWNRDIPHGLHLGNSMVAMQTLFTNLTPLCHICLMICSLTVTYDWFPVVVGKSWRVPHVGQELLTLSGNLISLPLGSSWFYSFAIHINIYIVYVWICQFNVDWLMTLVCLSGCFVSDLFHEVGICVNISLNHSNNLGKSYQIIICSNSRKIFSKSEIR